MTQYIDKSAVVAEILRRKKYYENIQMIKPVYESNIEDFNELISFLDAIEAIEVKEVDLEKELDKEWNKCEPIDEGMGLEIASIEHEQFDNIAKHFFELGLHHNTITEEDCRLIWNIGDEIPPMSEEDFFKELVRRYKERRIS